ncbi:hypothetical protein [Spirosoma fluminis]
MPFLGIKKRNQRLFRISFLSLTCLTISLLAIAQINLKYRLLNGYTLSTDAPVNKGKPTLFVFEQSETLDKVFQPAHRADRPNFTKEMVVGIALSPTSTPPKISVSKVFVQDSVLTVRYVRMADTTLIKAPLPTKVQPTLLVAIPKQRVLKTRLIENGKVIQTLQKREAE